MPEALVRTKDINNALKNYIATKYSDPSKHAKPPKISNLSGQDCIAVGISKNVVIFIEGNAGDYFGALNAGASIRLTGNAGKFLGDTMTAGEIIVKGDVMHGLGAFMSGGTIVVKGDAGGRVGIMNRGGSILVHGSVKNYTGLYMMAGDIIITGNVGEHTGHWMMRGSIYVGGDIGSLGTNAKEGTMTEADKKKLSELFKKYGIDENPELLSTYKKIEPEKYAAFPEPEYEKVLLKGVRA